jgi:hypothetical protein
MTVTGQLAARFGRSGVFLTLGELDSLLAASAGRERGRRTDFSRDLDSARRRLALARERRRRAVARASRW